MPQFLDGQGVIDLGQIGQHRGPMIIQPHGLSSKYLLKMSGIKDLVSKNSQTDTSAGATGYLDASNNYVAVAAETPLVTQRGNTSLGTFEQFLTSPLSPANQTTASLAPGEYFLWILGAGSVAVSANTATITGAGSATEATGVNFQVTVAGTIDIAIAGECTHFQLIDGSVSLYPIFHNAVGVVPDRAGTTKLADISTDFSKFRDSMGGEADGVELVVNGDFDSDTASWTPTSSILASVIGGQSGNSLELKSDGASYGRTAQNITVEVGASYRVAAWCKRGTLPLVQFRLGTSDNGFEYFDSGNLNDTAWTKHTKSIVATTTNLWITLKNPQNASNGINYFDSISVQKISPAAARHSFTWKPSHDYDISGAAAGTILKSGNFEIGYTATGGVTLTDGTNTATVSGVNWASGDDLSITASYGPNTTEDAQKMQLTVDATSSALTACLDTMGPDDDFIWGDTGTTVQNGVSGYVVTKLLQTDWV